MRCRLPTFFEHSTTMYALFQGAPERGVSNDPCGAWTMQMEHIPLGMRWAVFHHVCAALCDYDTPKAWVGRYDGETISFGGPEEMRVNAKIVLTNLRLGQVQWRWSWGRRPIIIPAEATWFSLPVASQAFKV